MHLKISLDDYYEALKLAPLLDFEVHLKRLPDACFGSNYNPTILKAWTANMDIPLHMCYVTMFQINSYIQNIMQSPSISFLSI